MNALSQDGLLALWENLRSLHPLDRGVFAIQSTLPEGREGVADWPLGKRNRALAELHCSAFGRSLHGWTSCRECGEKLEFQMDGDTLMQQGTGEHAEPMVVGERTYRLPTSRDLAAVAGEKETALAARKLLRRCCVEGGDVDQLTDEEMEIIGTRMAAEDPLAEIQLNFDCPRCHASFEESLDLVSFLWAEIDSRARRLLASIHTLASAYGWSEKDILGLSASRREIYLAMVDA